MKYSEPGKKGKKTQNKDTATKYISFLKAALDYGIESELLEINPLEKLRFSRSKPKTVYFLEDKHLKKLWNLKLETTADLARDLSLLVCYTGMDYPDLEKFLDNPHSYLASTSTGKQKIIINRSKPPFGECQIPYLQPITIILNKYKWKVPRLDDHTVNRFWQVFESQIGFKDGRVTVKILRKTAGSLFLNEGYTLEVVQKILGHTSISTTERHYAKIRDKRVDREMDRVGVEFAKSISIDK
ncbi:hypothetical protein GCM10028803_50330 [Larkinella knui]|uniref:Tyr recombinase domain-containing protein n=1 Tax=Larkinella knui TaxID=2025310 RepID=A0A3P1CR84_9BACT|nr:tyrosine-type recombinase/integrase [Larkinella knui]RRB15596.1 hypothetical protein EHT87_13855 [Larkinella knui]